MPEPIRVILADDHTLVRQGIRQFLEQAADIEVLGEASDGEEALRLVEALRPDLAILDIQMPAGGGVEATRRIQAKFPETRVLILTAYDDDPYVFALLQAGAAGYVLKTTEANELLEAVRAVHRGESALSPHITQKVVQQLRSGAPADAAKQVEPLTDRELEILRLVAEGKTNRAIGRDLAISARTVQAHLANIYGKLEVGSRTEAVTVALKRGWLVLE